jgi:glycosyltransferase involved in cell wall biosynthesis
METITPTLNGLDVLVTNFNKYDFIENFFPIMTLLHDLGAKVIVVDDGSTDGSRELLEREQAQNGRFSVLSQENKGSAAARNKAIEMTSNEYFCFIDIDDSIDVSVLTRLYSKVRADNSDLGIANYSVNGNSMTEPINDNTFNSQILSELGYWRICYKREFVENYNLKFMPTFAQLNGANFILDDYFWILHIAILQDRAKLTFLDEILYFYNLEQDLSQGINSTFERQARYFLPASKVFLEALIACEHLHRLDLLKAELEKSVLFHLAFLGFPNFMYALRYSWGDNKSTSSTTLSEVRSNHLIFVVVKSLPKVLRNEARRYLLKNTIGRKILNVKRSIN